MQPYVLHNYFRSSASFRVRIALNLAGIDFDYLSYHLRKGEHKAQPFLGMNPQGFVPVLQTPSGDMLTQSMAIIEWLNDTIPSTHLLPEDPLERARVRALAHMIGCDIHPINNLRVLDYLKQEIDADDERIKHWFCHWVHEGFRPLEARLSTDTQTGAYCHGDAPTMADLVLVPQVFNNLRFGVDMTAYPTITRIFGICMKHPAFKNAQPAKQPDNEN